MPPGKTPYCPAWWQGLVFHAMYRNFNITQSGIKLISCWYQRHCKICDTGSLLGNGLKNKTDITIFHFLPTKSIKKEATGTLCLFETCTKIKSIWAYILSSVILSVPYLRKFVFLFFFFSVLTLMEVFSFICMLGLSSVIDQAIQSLFPDYGMHKCIN